MDNVKNSEHFPEYDDNVQEISLLDILIILAKGKKLILGFMLAFALAGLVYALFFTKVEYTSEIQMLPISSYKTGNADAFAIQLPGNIVEGVVMSNQMLDIVIDKFYLMKQDGKAVTRISARKALRKKIKVEADKKNNVLTLTVKADSPEKAKEMAQFIYKQSVTSLEQMGIAATIGNKDRYLDDTIRKKMDEIQQDKNPADSASKMKNILEIYAVLTQYDENRKLTEKTPLVIELISPATLPDEKAPQGRGKIVLLSALLGLFVGMMAAFMSYMWRTMEEDPETAAKKAQLKALVGLRR